MLLTPATRKSARRSYTRTLRRAVALGYAIAGLVSTCGAQPGQGPCVLEVPAYDSVGNRIEARVTVVAPRDQPTRNLLDVQPRAIEASGTEVRFLDRALLRRVFLVTLDSSAGTATLPVFLMQCPQRASIRIGAAEAYGDTSFQTIRGRLTGCRFAGDWWVRATPMFGPLSSLGGLEAGVNQDGTFSLSGQMTGERHVIIVGKGKQAIKAFGLDVVVSRPTDAGIVHLVGRCPQ